MPLKSYEIVDKSPDGRLYAVITMDDDSTVGQYILPGSEKEMDAQVSAAVERIEAHVPVIDSDVLVGMRRTAIEIDASNVK